MVNKSHHMDIFVPHQASIKGEQVAFALVQRRKENQRIKKHLLNLTSMLSIWCDQIWSDGKFFLRSKYPNWPTAALNSQEVVSLWCMSPQNNAGGYACMHYQKWCLIKQEWAKNGRDVKIPKSGCLGSWPHTGCSPTVPVRAAVYQRVPLGDKCLMPDFLKHLPFRNAQKRMLWVKFTRLENLRKCEDLGPSKWPEYSEGPRYSCKLCDHRRDWEALSRKWKALAEIWSQCQRNLYGICWMPPRRYQKCA